jgi:mRNA interferase RelE/StbE
MSYAVSILRRAQKELALLPLEIYPEVRDRIRALSADPLPPESRKLKDREAWRLEVGHYRLIYELDRGTEELIVVHIGRRSDV